MSLVSLSIVSRGYLKEVIETMQMGGNHLATANIACDGYLQVPIIPIVPRTNIVPRRKRIIKEDDEELTLILKTLIKIWH